MNKIENNLEGSPAVDSPASASGPEQLPGPPGSTTGTWWLAFFLACGTWVFLKHAFDWDVSNASVVSMLFAIFMGMLYEGIFVAIRRWLKKSKP